MAEDKYKIDVGIL